MTRTRTTTGTTAADRAELLETRSLQAIPAGLRYGTPRQQLVFWFAFNANVVSVLTGFLAPVIGLNMAWSAIAILVGNLFGAVFVAFHAAQGPRLGLPQMVQSRAQFGYYGVIFFFVALFVLEFGFLAASQVVAADALHQVVPGLAVPTGIVLVTIPSVVVAVLGYRWIHRWQAVTIPVFLVSLVAFTVVLVARHPLPAGAFSLTPPPVATFLVVVSIMAVYQLAVAPFVSDYSRYLPAGASRAAVTRLTYLGLCLAPIWLELVGAWLAELDPDASLNDTARSIGGWWILLAIGLGLIGVVATNMYGGMLALVGILGLGTRERNAATIRIAGIVVTTLVGVGLALVAYRSFLSSFENFLLVLLFVFVPWTSVNLTDYYLVRRGNYDVSAILDRDGVYGAVNRNGWIAYLAGMLAQGLFVSQELATGPLVRFVGGADISWIVGLVVPGAVYLWLCRAGARRRRDTSSPATPPATR